MRRYSAKGLVCGAAFVVAIALQPGAALADTLFGAMEKAYVTNPTLNAARAGQRATDELVPQALVRLAADRHRAGRGPERIRGGESAGDTARQLARPCGRTVRNPASLAIVLNQPVFQGFRTVESTKAAEAQVDAGRQGLLQTEQQVLFDVVQAYMDVYAGRQLVVLRRQDVAALQAQVTRIERALRGGRDHPHRRGAVRGPPRRVAQCAGRGADAAGPGRRQICPARRQRARQALLSQDRKAARSPSPRRSTSRARSTPGSWRRPSSRWRPTATSGLPAQGSCPVPACRRRR